MNSKNTQNTQKSNQGSIVKIMYGSVFVLLLPAILYFWAAHTKTIVNIPVFQFTNVSLTTMLIGALLMAGGMLTLLFFGKGLPMNAFPPKNLVTRGAYKLFSHPIYLGAFLFVAGFSLYLNSGSGFWMVTPVFGLLCIAYVMGFENDRTYRLFPEYKKTRFLIALPQNSNEKADAWNKISAYMIAIAPFCLALYISQYLAKYISSPAMLVFESAAFKTVYADYFLMAVVALLLLITPVLIKTKTQMRFFIFSVLSAIFYGMFVIVITGNHPLIQMPSGENPGFGFSDFFRYATFPNLILLYTLISLHAIQKSYHLNTYAFLLILTLALFTATAGYSQSAAGIFGALFLYFFIEYRAIVWSRIQKLAETIANSWKEIQVKNVRMINHGIYGGLASGTGGFIMGALIGKQHFWGILIVVIGITITMFLWAQIIEGSEKLKRPAGFYGGVLGMFIGAAIAHFSGLVDFYLVAASAAVAGPWIQAIGRLRCLVQGCCHGRETTDKIGIRYFHPRSRVVTLSNLKGKYLYPTPVYSIITNIFSGILLLKLWTIGLPNPFFIGLFLILNSASRFIEEHYRGEPQTPVYYGLRLYQWVAVVMILAGIFLTTLSSNAIAPEISVNATTLLFGLSVGIIGFIATGVDFPKSNMRFSRLT